MIGVVARRAADQPQSTAFTFEGEPTSYARLWSGARQAARHLRDLGVGPGSAVVVALPNGPDFFEVFYGLQAIGGVPVPVHAGLGTGQLVMMRDAVNAAAVVVADGAWVGEEHGGVAVPVPVVTPASWQGGAMLGDPVHVDGSDIAFIQFTSGTTGVPRGVQISHANLVTNVRQLIAGMAITRDDRFVSWLPVYHDMGLILKTMVPMYLGARLHLLPTSLRDVLRWPRAIEATGASFTAAPDFAYRLMLRQMGSAADIDLSTLRVALNAAEPVREATVREFGRLVGTDGVMVAGYGLAEATVGVSTWPPGTPPRVDERGFVSVGPPFPGVEVRIGDPPVGDGTAGEILVKSTANAVGYLGDPSDSADVFGADGYVRTGDLGHLDADGNLYVVGRKKNIIIQGGRNLAPSQFCEIADRRPEVRMSAAVGVDTGGLEGEQAYVVAELRDSSAPRATLRELATDIAGDIWRDLGIRPARVLLVARGAIPLTHNGKVRHGDLRSRIADGSLAASVLYPDW